MQIITGEQSKKVMMETLKVMGPYHIIVDNGSRIPDHMDSHCAVCGIWLNSADPGGLYVTEDPDDNY